ncbi:MAG: Rpn family recombination-promoting nuclease/putative transposase [Eubacterium sp.]|nr:Rpn family recombination-promoting nuclease/putative transposase [Eubacterium sp.]
MQRRDILKEYGSGRFLVASLGIENQSTIDSDMPVRVMGYDYAAYRDQINKSKKRVPVITIILNFSRTEWKTPLSLKDMFHLSEDLDPFVQDYKIHVFNIAFLPKEVRNQFTSDFKIVADYFAKRDNPDYQPDTQAIKHVEGVLEMFRVFTDDMRYDMIKSDVIEKKNKRRGSVDVYIRRPYGEFGN